MHDGIRFEQQGKPATTVLTETFSKLATATKGAVGFSQFPFVVVPHPLGSSTETADKARNALPAIVAILTSQR